jgi:hypothetical protein
MKAEVIRVKTDTYLGRLLSLLDVGEDELLKAVISAFFPCQPGALRAAWEKRGYRPPGSTAAVWDLFEAADFRCSNANCGSMHRITLDHVDRDILNNTIQNLRVVCFDCNRKRVGKARQTNLSVAVVKTALDLAESHGRFPKDAEIAAKIGITSSQLSGSRYSVRVLRSLYNSKKPGRTHLNSK